MPRTFVLPSLAAYLALPALLAGCGCFYGTASEVTVDPPTDCLEIHAAGLCARLAMSGTNGCEETLTVLPVEDVEPVEVLPGETFDLDDVTPYADMETDNRYCSTDAVVRAELGDEELTFSFDVERINRGLRLPCD